MIERCNIQEEEEPSRSAPPVPRASIPADDSGVITTDGEGNIAITNTSDGSLDNADTSRISISQQMGHKPPPLPAILPPSIPVVKERERSLSRNSIKGNSSRSSKKLSFSTWLRVIILTRDRTCV